MESHTDHSRSSPSFVQVASSPAQVQFCPICQKPFTQESSYSRHVRYCHRRHGIDLQTSRQKACHNCNRAKVKCDFRSPCSRCASKGRTCAYDSPHTAKAKTKTDAGEAAERSTAASLTNHNEWPMNLSLDASESSPFDLVTQFQDYGMDNALSISIAGEPLAPKALSPFNIDPESPIGLQGWGTIEDAEKTLQLLPYHEAATFLSNVSSMSSGAAVTGGKALICGQPISSGCRQLITSTLLSYPRMLLRQETLPPFIHPYGGAPGSSNDESSSALPVVATTLRSPEPLATCISIAHVFAVRTNANQSFLWRTIEAEQRRLNDEMHTFTRDEALAAIQAMLIYIIMRLDDAGPAYFATNLNAFVTVSKLSERFTECVSGPFLAVDAQTTRPDWAEWVHDETRRRVANVCFLISMAVGSGPCQFFPNPGLIPLPCSKTLWEANNAWAWQGEYNAAMSDQRIGNIPLKTLNDLVNAQDNAAGRWRTGHRRNELDTWVAGADGLGFVLLAAASTA